MSNATHSWADFKALLDEDIAKSMFYRGQSCASWGLVSTFHRMVSPPSAATYWQLIEVVHDYVATWTDRKWNLVDNTENAAFLGFLQHNGFPTPLLDWSYSPYVAAFFAFEGVADAMPADDNVAIFRFDYQSWSRDWTQVYDIAVQTPHVSVLQSQSRGNRKQLLHQGAYTYSTVPDQEAHVRLNEATRQSRGVLGLKAHYLDKFTISVHEKPRAMRDFARMGLTPMTLFPGVEGVCRHLKHELFPLSRVGQTPEERAAEFLAALDRAQTAHRPFEKRNSNVDEKNAPAAQASTDGDARN